MRSRLADTIRARRMSRGLGREELARLVRCDVRSIRRWEGGGLPQARYIPALREALDLSIEQVDALLLAEIGGEVPLYRIEDFGYARRLGLGFHTLLERLIELDRRLVGSDAALGVDGTAQWVPIFEALPDSWRLLTVDDAIVGNWHFVPLDPKVYARCRTGDVTDADLRLDHLRSLDLPGVHDMYVAALLLEPAHQDGRTLRLLLDAFCHRLSVLAGREVYFDRVCASAWTAASTVLCRRLGMRPVGRVRGGKVEIFEATMPEILAAINLPGARLVLDRYADAFPQGHRSGPPEPREGKDP